MTDMNEQDRGSNISPPGNTNFIGPVLPPGQGKDDNIGKNAAGVNLSDYSGPENANDYGSTWVNKDMARAIRARTRGLPHAQVDGYYFDSHVPSTLNEDTPPPPQLYDPGLNSAVGIDPDSNTG